MFSTTATMRFDCLSQVLWSSHINADPCDKWSCLVCYCTNRHNKMCSLNLEPPAILRSQIQTTNLHVFPRGCAVNPLLCTNPPIILVKSQSWSSSFNVRLVENWAKTTSRSFNQQSWGTYFYNRVNLLQHLILLQKNRRKHSNNPPPPKVCWAMLDWKAKEEDKEDKIKHVINHRDQRYNQVPPPYDLDYRLVDLTYWW